VRVMRAYWTVEVKFHSFLILPLDGIIDQLHTPAAFPSIKESSLFMEFEAGWAPEPIGTFRTVQKLLDSSL